MSIEMYKLLVVGVTASLILSGCATPREMCISQSMSEYRQALNSRSEIQSNVSRGYAVHSQQIPYQYTGQCQDEYLNYYSCSKTGYRAQETPVSIDMEREEKNLQRLDQRISVLREQSNADAIECRRIHPE